MNVDAYLVREPKGSFVLERLALAAPAADEVLVRIHGVGICHTDLSVRDGALPVPLPAVLGHEGSGEIVAVGDDVKGLSIGDPVVLSQAFCGRCRTCLDGSVWLCPQATAFSLGGVRPDGSRTFDDGSGTEVSGCFVGQSSFATHALARAVNVVKVTADAPLELLGPLGCGIMTGAGAVMDTLRPRAGSTLTVFGAGGVGLSAVMAARAVGCSQIIAVDPNPSRCDLARELGATDVVDPSQDDSVDRVTAITGGGSDYVVEASGVASVGPVAVSCSNQSGITIVLGAPPYGARLDLDWYSVMAGRTVRGAINGGANPHNFIPRAVDLHRRGMFPFDKLVRFYDFDDMTTAVAEMERGEVVKPVLRIA